MHPQPIRDPSLPEPLGSPLVQKRCDAPRHARAPRRQTMNKQSHYEIALPPRPHHSGAPPKRHLHLMPVVPTLVAGSIFAVAGMRWARAAVPNAKGRSVSVRHVRSP